MENASKALTMAGSVLIGLIIMSMLILFFRELRTLKQYETDLDRVDQATEFNKQFDVYNRNLYGSELLSLANKVADYNKNQADAEDYQPIEIQITIRQGKDIDNTYFTAGTYRVNQIEEKLNKIEDEAKDFGKKRVCSAEYDNIKRQIKTLATMRTKEIEDLGFKLNQQVPNLDYMTLQQAINKYVTLKSLVTEFKSKTFELDGFEFDKNNGRIVKMKYKL